MSDDGAYVNGWGPLPLTVRLVDTIERAEPNPDLFQEFDRRGRLRWLRDDGSR
jgi:hypothetical protein